MKDESYYEDCREREDAAAMVSAQIDRAGKVGRYEEWSASLDGVWKAFDKGGITAYDKAVEAHTSLEDSINQQYNNL